MTQSLLGKFENKYIQELNVIYPNFRAGDTVEVSMKVREGATERIQVFAGLVLRIKNRQLGSTFTVKKDSHGESTERTFLKYSPMIAGVKVVRRGKVRRAKLYYMRELTGKAARIKEDTSKKRA